MSKRELRLIDGTVIELTEGERRLLGADLHLQDSAIDDGYQEVVNGKALFWPRDLPRKGTWAYLDDRFHHYPDDKEPHCGFGPTYEGYTKTPGGPWCVACIALAREATG